MGPALRRGSEGGHVVTRAGIVDGCGRVRVRGIDNSQDTKSLALVQGPSPPSLLLVPLKHSFPSTKPWTLPASTSSMLDSSQSKLECAVLEVCIPLLSLLTFIHLCIYTIADRRPIDPPPIVQLRVLDKARNLPPSPSPSPPPQPHHPPPSHPHAHTHESSGPLDTSMLTPAGFGAGPFLQNPYYFMFASLAKPDDDTELHWMKVRYRASLSPRPCGIFHILKLLVLLALSRTERRVAQPDL